MYRFLSTAAYFVVLVSLFFITTDAPAQIQILENFADGDTSDGMPLHWNPLTTSYPGTYDASTGDYYMEPSRPNSIVASVVESPSLNDISIRTRLRISEESQPGSSTG